MNETPSPGGAALARTIAAHVDALCGIGIDRFPGSARNRMAGAYVRASMRSLGLEVEVLGFDVPEWSYSTASVTAGDSRIAAHPGPYSPPADVTGHLVAASSAEELSGIDSGGGVLLLHGPIAATQLTPRAYPWYSDPAHTAILEAIESLAPAAVLAATGINPAMTAALSPFPLIEDTSFAIPSAYLTVNEAEVLMSHLGREVHVEIDSRTSPSTGEQPIGRLAGDGAGRILVCAHFDTKPDTPGALDNAAGLATVLAVAELLTDGRRTRCVEFVPFNGEDHSMSPGEVAYLAAYPAIDDIALMINVDAAGSRGGPTLVSSYASTPAVDAAVASAMVDHPGVAAGDPWPSSDHMIFAMRQVPCLALTSNDFEENSARYHHTPQDTPELVDPTALAEAARFIAGVIEDLDPLL